MTKNDLQHQVRATHLPTHRRLGGQALRTTGSVTARACLAPVSARARACLHSTSTSTACTRWPSSRLGAAGTTPSCARARPPSGACRRCWPRCASRTGRAQGQAAQPAHAPRVGPHRARPRARRAAPRVGREGATSAVVSSSVQQCPVVYCVACTSDGRVCTVVSKFARTQAKPVVVGAGL